MVKSIHFAVKSIDFTGKKSTFDGKNVYILWTKNGAFYGKRGLHSMIKHIYILW